jgi:hypothetical protein
MKIRDVLVSLSWLSAACPAAGQVATPSPKPLAITLTYPATTGVSSFSIPPTVAFAAKEFYAVGGERLALMVTVEAPLGTHLRIYADVSQLAGAIAAPWQRDTPVSEELVFGDRTSMVVPCTLPALRAVQRKTEVTVTLHTEPKTTHYPDGLVVSGYVYPREEPGAWQKQFAALLAQAGIRRVAVFGGWKNTAGFLREQKVPFDDLGADWPDASDAHTLYLGSVIAKANESGILPVPEAFRATPGVRLILFEPWETELLPPGVYQTAGKAGGSIWKVTLPDLFAGITLNAPHGLETLTAIFQEALLPCQSAAGEDPPSTPTP